MMQMGLMDKIEESKPSVGGVSTQERAEQLLEAVPTAKTVPQIFIDGEYIGTYEHLKTHFNL